MQKEPLAIIGTIGSLIGAFIVLMQSFGIPVTDEQLNAIQDFVTIAAPILIMLIGRQFVFSPNTTEALTDKAYDAGLPPTQPQPDLPSPPADNDPAAHPDSPFINRLG